MHRLHLGQEEGWGRWQSACLGSTVGAAPKTGNCVNCLGAFLYKIWLGLRSGLTVANQAHENRSKQGWDSKAKEVLF